MMFERFPKIPRYSRQCIITEKIDGTNAQIHIDTMEEADVRLFDDSFSYLAGPGEAYRVWVGSRTRWITPQNDNFGFAQWVLDHLDELIATLGIGRHYGEWWGSGIQRGYGLKEKRFSLFNTTRWADLKSDLVHVVPVICVGEFGSESIEYAMRLLRYHGSFAAPGFMKPEGIVIYHVQGNVIFKKTIEGDAKGKDQ